MESNQLTKEFRPLGEWHIFGMGYLLISETACEEMIKSVADGKMIKNDLYIPTIYNIKHAIEIFEKLIILIADDKNLLNQNKDWGHDIKTLFARLKSKIDFKGMAKYYTCNPSDQYLTDIPLIEKTIDECSNLVDKYYHLSFLIEKIGTDFIVEDGINDAFRYPQNNLLIKPKYQKILEKITINDIEQIKNDIIELKKFLKLELSIGIYIMNKGTIQN